MNLNVWQKDLDDNTELFSLNMVGTHDCVTNHVQFSYITRCQELDIYEQLSIGVRCLDIRVEPRGKRIYMVHGIAKAYNTANHLAKQMDMREVLAQCYQFLDENPSECIVFQFKNDNNKQMAESFDNMYNAYLKPNKSKWYLGERSPLLGEVRGKLVFVRRCEKDEEKEYPLGTGIDFSSWVEQDEVTPEALELSTGGENDLHFIIQDRFNYKPEPRWEECIKPFLDSMKPFDGTYVVNYLSTAGGLKGPYANSQYINPQFMDYELDSKCYYGMIYMDFPTEEIVEKVVKTNYEAK